MDENPPLNDAICHMIAIHSGQVDKSGMSYHYHPLRVMLRLGDSATNAERCAALLHDVVEDTDTTLDDLASLGYQEDVLTMVRLLTRTDDVTHSDYLTMIALSGNVGAMRVKLADLYDNANVSRAEACRDEEIKAKILGMINSRYKPAIKRMKAALFNATGKEPDIYDGDIDVELDFTENNDE